ncbi:hypothetical protein GTW40_15585 [Streptomyces sp. SID4985]|uniref:hypothetical protein n=1 Tax=Streptomyces sp. SID4985 TaxID=2690292 RepID=UPI00136B8710|nr:hypothetical protein [Streptomyces sp. SID4985]MYQ46461.1 hypothetical protein [Streptomyces sp. SID4985]
MSLVELIAQADARGLAASGLACSDRCVPLVYEDDDLLRPLWAHLADGSDWSESLEKARAALTTVDPGEDEAALLVRRMLEEAPAERSGEALREWADACSLAALQVHRLLDPATEDTAPAADAAEDRDGGTEETSSPLVAAELRRQTVVLELVAEHGANGLRRALDVSIEGRRVLQAVVSRRARSQG